MTEQEAEDLAVEALRPFFKEDRIPDIIRRPAGAWEGRRAIDLIMEGRVEEVRETYDRGLTYQS